MADRLQGIVQLNNLITDHLSDWGLWKVCKCVSSLCYVLISVWYCPWCWSSKRMCNYKSNVDDRGETLVNYGSPKILMVFLTNPVRWLYWTDIDCLSQSTDDDRYIRTVCCQFVLSCWEFDKADPPLIVIGMYACLACKLKMGDIIISIGWIEQLWFAILLLTDYLSIKKTPSEFLHCQIQSNSGCLLLLSTLCNDVSFVCEAKWIHHCFPTEGIAQQQ